MSQFGGIKLLLIGVLGVFVLATFLSFPVWKQNRYQELIRTRIALKKEEAGLEKECVLLDLQVRKLSSRTRIETAAAKMGLSWNENWKKIRVGEGSYE